MIALQKKYRINLVVELTKKEFSCLFQQYWKHNNKNPYAWLYNENKLLCNLKHFLKNYKNLAEQFLEQFNIPDIIPNVNELYNSLLPKEGLLYKYFVTYVYEDISYLFDSMIDREDYCKQLFYYDRYSQTYPNLSNDLYILLVGNLIIFDKNVQISLQYKIIDK